MNHEELIRIHIGPHISRLVTSNHQYPSGSHPEMDMIHIAVYVQTAAGAFVGSVEVNEQQHALKKMMSIANLLGNTINLQAVVDANVRNRMAQLQILCNYMQTIVRAKHEIFRHLGMLETTSSLRDDMELFIRIVDANRSYLTKSK